MYIDINSIFVIINVVTISLLFIIGILVLFVNKKVKEDNKKKAMTQNAFNYDLESSKLKLPSTPIYLNDFDKLLVPVIYLIDQSVNSAVTKFKAEFGRNRINGNGVIEYYITPDYAEKMVSDVCRSVRESLSDEFILSMNRFLSIEGFGKLVNEIVLEKIYLIVKETNSTVYNPQVKQSSQKNKDKRELDEMPNEVIKNIASMAGLTVEDVKRMNNTDEIYDSVFKGLNS